MKTVCTPDALNTDGRCVYLKKYRRRLWILMYDLERLRARKHEEDLARWTAPIWAANLDARPRQFDKDCLVLRDLGLMHPEEFRLIYEQPDREMDLAEFFRERRNGNGHQARPLYPSDQAQYRAARKAANDSTTDSADTPQTTPQDSADAPLAGVRESIDDRSIDRTIDSFIKIDSIDRSGEEADSENALVVSAHQGMTANNISRHRADELLKEYGAKRCQEVIDCLPYWKGKKPGAMIETGLKENWPLPSGYVKAKEQAQQTMPMLGSVQGGKSAPPAASRPPQPTIKEALGFLDEPFSQPPDMTALRQMLDKGSGPEERGQAHGS